MPHGIGYGGRIRRLPDELSLQLTKPGMNAVDPPAGIHFIPGNPFDVRAGIEIFF